jgi:hypothetical protein
MNGPTPVQDPGPAASASQAAASEQHWQHLAVISKLGSNYSLLLVLPPNYWQLLAIIGYYCYYFFAKSFAIIGYYCTMPKN